jgi:hypothetical protein
MTASCATPAVPIRDVRFDDLSFDPVWSGRKDSLLLPAVYRVRPGYQLRLREVKHTHHYDTGRVLLVRVAQAGSAARAVNFVRISVVLRRYAPSL